MKLLKNLSRIMMGIGLLIIFGTMENSDLYNYSVWESLRGVSFGTLFLVSGSFTNALSKVKVIIRKVKSANLVKHDFSGGCYEYKKAV